MNFQLKSTITILMFFWFSVAGAQKLPNVQQISVRAPQNVKIEGKLLEWDDTFQAHNHATDILYTIANDDENLYLIVQADNILTINRVLGKGLTFNIQKQGRKDKSGRISFTYPAYEKNQTIIFGFDKHKGAVDSASEEITIRNANRQIGQLAKHIYVTGVSNVDTLLSVYNETGIKVQSAIDNRKNYNMEFAIPLKYLALSPSEAGKFTYQIIVNGQVPQFGAGQGFAPTPAGEILRQRSLNAEASKISPTDFWGEYTLAKK